MGDRPPRRARLAEPEIVGLVAADVEPRAREVRQQLAVQPVEEREPLGGRCERERSLRDLSPRQLDPAGRLRERAVALVDEPALEVTEAVLVRDQGDEALAAIRVELADLLGGERRGRGPDLAVCGIRERVLDVELELVDLPAREQVDQRAQRGHRRHLVAADVEHHRADQPIRMILDLHARHAVVDDELRERARAVEHAGRIAADDRRAVGSHRQAIALRGEGRIEMRRHDAGVVDRPAQGLARRRCRGPGHRTVARQYQLTSARHERTRDREKLHAAV